MNLNIDTFSVRRLETPLDQQGVRFYSAIAKADLFLKDLYDWRGINPRDPKTTSRVAKKIAESAEHSPDMFMFKNRGLVVMADKIEFDNQRGVLTLTMTDKSKHGLLDGGHTCKILIDELNDLPPEKRDSLYLKLEIMEGFSEVEDIVDIVDARNTSTQVKDQSLMNLQGDFNPLKDALRGESYFDLIAFKENELYSDDAKKPIDIRDIISYLICFDAKNFGQDRQPSVAYVSKAAALNHFSENHKEMNKLYPLLKDILRLRDMIYEGLPKLYNKSVNQLDSNKDVAELKSGGRFGRFTGVTYKKKASYDLYFIDESSNYGIPSGFIYPILAAFRALIKDRGDRYEWSHNPFDVFEKHGTLLALRVCERALEHRNPNKLGKEISLWRGCYEGLKLALIE